MQLSKSSSSPKGLKLDGFRRGIKFVISGDDTKAPISVTPDTSQRGNQIRMRILSRQAF
jgi:hypothetical protein